MHTSRHFRVPMPPASVFPRWDLLWTHVHSLPVSHKHREWQFFTATFILTAALSVHVQHRGWSASPHSFTVYFVAVVDVLLLIFGSLIIIFSFFLKCVCTMCTWVPIEARSVSCPEAGVLRWLWATWCGWWELNLGPSGRDARGVSSWAFSPVPGD